MISEKTDSLNINSTSYEDNTMSVIIRSHQEKRLPFLDETLFSLALQYWKDLEIVIVLQNGTEEFKNKVIGLIEKQPFSVEFKFQIHCFNVPPNVDGRSSLLNHGIKYAKGKYIAFLDDDDFVYQHCYKTLINQLKNSNCSIAVGGCRTACIVNTFENPYIEKKENPFGWGKNKLDLVIDNFIPIHSYVIDRTRISDADLYFDDHFHLLEDYEFLLRMASKYEFDFTKLNTVVCEYRLHSNNSLPFDQGISEKHSIALQLLNERKKEIKFFLPINQLKPLILSQPNLTETEQTNNQRDIITSNLQSNPHLIRNVLNNTGDKIYNFFSKRPSLERKMSRLVHFFWK